MRSALIAIACLAACGHKASPPALRVILHEDGVENAYPRLSSDGREILYQSNRGGTWQLYVLDIATGTSRALTREGNNNLPDWSPDGRLVAFVSDRDGNEEIYVMNRDGSEPRRLTTNPGRDIHPYFSPDGKTLLYNSQRTGRSLDVFALDLASGTEHQLTETRQDETCARYAPDGSRFVLLRNDASSDDVWIIDAHAEHNLTRTPHVRDGWPVFGPDGRVYYASMALGSFSIYRSRSDGTKLEQLTFAAPDEEDARPFVSHDGRRLIFNRRRGNAIDIMELSPLPS
ncbi:MAG TPA: DPP IV N-terminal domain-containing protein [Kofleriaceae bacterium]|nr:DPP IV N-terminal domain-containing protein [Kofleriaceae bacterium]